MNPEVSAAWNIVRKGLASVSATLDEHQKLQTAAATIEAELNKAAAPKKKR